jgi:peptidoglycan LD-endopeptidase CwlK
MLQRRGHVAHSQEETMSDVRRDLDELHPVVRAKVKAVLTDIKKAKLSFEVFEAYRIPERQRKLFNQGGVTKADAWQSYHQYGMAVDIVLKENGQWSWETGGGRLALWEQMNAIGRSHGLEPLSWEKPHLQLADTSIADLRAGRFLSGGDDSWAAAVTASVERWPQGAPPAPIPSGERPRLPGLEIDTEALAAPWSAARVQPEGSEKAAFERAQAIVKIYEGGFTDNPADPGGPTNWGITHTTLAQWRNVDSVTAAQVEAMSYQEAKDIYFARYWSRMKCGAMPGPLALAVYNVGLHSGVKTGATFLQEALNAEGAGLETDGDIGSLTLAQISRFDLSQTLTRVIDSYEARLRAHPRFDVFGKGFMSRIALLRAETSKWLVEWQAEQGKDSAPPATTGGILMSGQQNTNDLVAALLRLLVAANGTGGSGTASPTPLPNAAQPALGLEQLAAALKAIVDSRSGKTAGLGPVNGALGTGIGELLNGRKTAIGIFGSLLTYLAGNSSANSVFAKVGSMLSEAIPAVSGLSEPMLPIFLAMTLWGVLGKMENYTLNR